MSDTVREPGGSGPSHRAVEIGVTLATAIIGLLTVVGSLRVGVNWGAEGPRAGFFPFYIGLLILISAAVNLAATISQNVPGRLFSRWGQMGQVLAVVVPTAIYVTIIPRLGIYVSSALLIATFMKWMSSYRWWIIVGISLLVPIVTFFMFEKWFLVPLPKGPVEEWLGY
jgi:hypothetical protein